MTTFTGCSAWPIDDEIIEIFVESDQFDLHNDADIVDFKIDLAQTQASLRIDFDARQLGFTGDEENFHLSIEFRCVDSLHLEICTTSGEDSSLFYSFEYRGGDQFGISTGFLDAIFSASEVVVSRLFESKRG